MVGRIADLDIHPVKKPQNCTANNLLWFPSANEVFISQFPSPSLSASTRSLQPLMPAKQTWLSNMHLSVLTSFTLLRMFTDLLALWEKQQLFLLVCLFQPPLYHEANPANEQLIQLLGEWVSRRFLARQIWTESQKNNMRFFHPCNALTYIPIVSLLYKSKCKTALQWNWFLLLHGPPPLREQGVARQLQQYSTVGWGLVGRDCFLRKIMSELLEIRGGQQLL